MQFLTVTKFLNGGYLLDFDVWFSIKQVMYHVCVIRATDEFKMLFCVKFAHWESPFSFSSYCYLVYSFNYLSILAMLSNPFMLRIGF